MGPSEAKRAFSSVVCELAYSFFPLPKLRLPSMVFFSFASVSQMHGYGILKSCHHCPLNLLLERDNLDFANWDRFFDLLSSGKMERGM
jgi:hypothetical protein